MEITGIVTVPPQIERGESARGPWSRATVIVEYEQGQYPKSIALQNRKDAEAFAKLKVGTKAKFSFDTRAREYNGKYYNDIDCWRWDILEAGGSTVADNDSPF